MDLLSSIFLYTIGFALMGGIVGGAAATAIGTIKPDNVMDTVFHPFAWMLTVLVPLLGVALIAEAIEGSLNVLTTLFTAVVVACWGIGVRLGWRNRQRRKVELRIQAPLRAWGGRYVVAAGALLLTHYALLKTLDAAPMLTTSLSWPWWDQPPVDLIPWVTSTVMIMGVSWLSTGAIARAICRWQSTGWQAQAPEDWPAEVRDKFDRLDPHNRTYILILLPTVLCLLPSAWDGALFAGLVMRIGLLLIGLTMTNDGPETWLSLPKSVLAIPRMLTQTKLDPITTSISKSSKFQQSTGKRQPVGRRLKGSGSQLLH